MKYFVLLLAFLLTSCYSYSAYKPDVRYTEAEINFVFDRDGFRGINGWIWQVGTLCFEYDRYKKWSIYGWAEEVDSFEEWVYIIDDSNTSRIKGPHHYQY